METIYGNKSSFNDIVDLAIETQSRAGVVEVFHDIQAVICDGITAKLLQSTPHLILCSTDFVSRKIEYKFILFYLG